ncbi:MAG: hypothetical protein K1X64_14695 [Myxococcaceae bacterium]|nr:hypothetical protein [Myxococcaceae bacterium]
MRWLSVGLAAVLLSTPACTPTPCPEPFYAGTATDEVWVVLSDAKGRATLDDGQAIHLTHPMPEATISATGAKPDFTWSSSLSASRAPAPEGLWRKPIHAGMSSRVTAWLFDTLLGHEAPVTGPMHWLRFTTAQAHCPAVEVVTSANRWTPDDAAWAQLKTAATGKTVTIEAISAYVTENRITEGPFRPSTFVNFTLGQ